ncbi:hypothetical protein M406DRAFT_75207 [Cryphonectria parasitica EP155]|uniref:Clr5 domain-containing protein n=1 Tax=Cryphonectria parasitica (strain ATCC 38755 / EP155) TaxID=660469 RepID=A0A9P4XZV9_CRYP1|nr:uncharacterized protein M406DRAFT_75207 [Cryphonectria parasitica EP155]KAF3763981.1 hypothetical protein M406DRAFT_75207 [Cryphonectria parasitica EP155]
MESEDTDYPLHDRFLLPNQASGAAGRGEANTPSAPSDYMAVTLSSPENSLSSNVSSYGQFSSDRRSEPDTTSSRGSPAEGSSRGSNNYSEEQWNRHREVITRLYWEENLPMPTVREYMSREYGFDATPRAYKFRFKKWGLRKNIKEHEARELISGNKNPEDFWAGTKRLNFERRIARHLEKSKEGSPSLQEGRRATPTPTEVATRAFGSREIPRRMKAPGLHESVEAAKHYWELWLSHDMEIGGIWLKGQPGTEHRCPSGLVTEDDVDFFPLFQRGLQTLSDDNRTRQAFADINKSFNYLKGLIYLHHPFIYKKIMDIAASYRRYPASEACFRVCCVLVKHSLDLFRELYGPEHPLNNMWSIYFEILESQDVPEFSEHFLNTISATCPTVWRKTRGFNDIGSLRIEAYVPSSVRGQNEEVLRRNLILSKDDPSLVPSAQENRLALAEALISHQKLDEAQGLLMEAGNSSLVDFINPEDKAFWMAELEWRLGHVGPSLKLLEQVLTRIDSRPATSSLVSSNLSLLQVLGVLYHRHTIVLSAAKANALRDRILELITTRTNTLESVTLHLWSCDYELQLRPQYGNHIQWRPSPGAETYSTR